MELFVSLRLQVDHKRRRRLRLPVFPSRAQPAALCLLQQKKHANTRPSCLLPPPDVFPSNEGATSPALPPPARHSARFSLQPGASGGRSLAAPFLLSSLFKKKKKARNYSGAVVDRPNLNNEISLSNSVRGAAACVDSEREKTSNLTETE